MTGPQTRTTSEWQAHLQIICADRFGNKTGRLAAILIDWVWDFWPRTQYLTLKDTLELYEYSEGVYVKTGERTLSEWVERNMNTPELKPYVSTKLVNDVIDRVKRQTYTERSAFAQNGDYICLENGVLSTNTHEFFQHTPDFRFMAKIPIKYDPQAACPVFDAFLLSTLPEQKDRDALTEFMGYCLHNGLPFHKSFMLVGSGANGKSTFLGCLKAFLGKDNVASISLQELETGSFALTSLIGKAANIYPDLSHNAMKTTGKFKALTGGDAIMTNVKYADYATIVNTAKMIFSCNEIPRVVEDDSEAYFRRWNIITFPMTFTTDSADPALLEKLTAPAELSGILNKAIAGLGRLMANKKFSNDGGINAAREHYVRMSDPIKAFIMDEIENDGGVYEESVDGWVLKTKVYHAYADYCREKKYITKTEDAFFRFLKRGVNIESTRQVVDGTRVWVIKGLKERDNGGAVQQETQVVLDDFGEEQ